MAENGVTVIIFYVLVYLYHLSSSLQNINVVKAGTTANPDVVSVDESEKVPIKCVTCGLAFIDPTEDDVSIHFGSVHILY